MSRLGALYVLEGPDGVGKSTLAEAVAERLRRDGGEVALRSFPGRDPGTLGELVYRVHHAPEELGVRCLTETARQTLHVAAHLDVIEREFKPLLARGGQLVLDRFWWSTWVYGTVGGMPRSVLDALVRLELEVWGDVEPTIGFLIDRDSPWRVDHAASTWEELRRTYRKVMSRATGRGEIVVNDRPIDLVVDELMADIRSCPRPGEVSPGRDEIDNRRQPQLDLGLGPTRGEVPRRLPDIISSVAPARPTRVYDTYWQFAVERQNIFFRRWRRQRPPWTSDPILRRHRFTNAYRASDRVSQYLIRNVIYKGEQDPNEIVFRTLLFKLFNRIETWELLQREFGEVTLENFSVARYSGVLAEAQAHGERIYSAAYIMPPARSFNEARKHTGHLRLLKAMLDDDVVDQLVNAGSLRSAFETLRAYPMLGDFLAYQFVIDLNYSAVLDFSEMEFIVPGPGARRGIRKCFSDRGGLSEADIIRLVTERQQEEFERRGLRFLTLWGRPLQLVDCQNLFCEVDKYARVAHPELNDGSGRQRIKQVYRTRPEPVTNWYPPKWGLNDRIAKEAEEHDHHQAHDG